MFNNDPEVVRLVARVLPLVALFQVRQPWNLVDVQLIDGTQILDGLGAMTGTILRVTGRQVRRTLLNSHTS